VKAVVLVGGFGTRLRPLTETVKKELLPLVDRPILGHTLDRLVRYGVTEVVMSSPYLEDAFDPFIASRAGSPTITWVTEAQPLGTGGAIVNTREALGAEPFFALNGDICTDLDLSAMLAFHRERGAAVTIALQHVEDARAFGLVETDADGRVRAFREKPEAVVPGDVNAGTYLIDPSVFAPWTTGDELSIEREVFPRVIDAGHPVFGFLADAYWIDLGTPEKYLQAHADLLAGRAKGVVYPSPWIHASASVDMSALLGDAVCVGDEARIGASADLDRAVLLAGSSLGDGAWVRETIVGPGARIGAGARVQACVLGAGAHVPDGLDLRDARIGPDQVAVAG
jgi:mannose-1-phosphate guanylyltransferase